MKRYACRRLLPWQHQFDSLKKLSHVVLQISDSVLPSVLYGCEPRSVGQTEAVAMSRTVVHNELYDSCSSLDTEKGRRGWSCSMHGGMKCEQVFLY